MTRPYKRGAKGPGFVAVFCRLVIAEWLCWQAEIDRWADDGGPQP